MAINRHNYKETYWSDETASNPYLKPSQASVTKKDWWRKGNDSDPSGDRASDVDWQAQMMGVSNGTLQKYLAMGNRSKPSGRGKKKKKATVKRNGR